MIRSPKRLNSAQYDENYQGWPKRQPARPTILTNIGKLMRYSISAYEIAREKMWGAKLWDKWL